MTPCVWLADPSDELGMGTHDHRIVVISDTHLGRPGMSAGKPEALRPLWTDADELIVNGDVAELHDPRHRARAARHVIRLQELCEADGVKLTTLSGNHDPLLSDIRHMTLEDDRVFITHGDILHPAISPWNGTESDLRTFNEEALSMLPPDEREHFMAQLAASQHASHMHWDPPADPPANENKRQRAVRMTRKAVATLWYWHTLPKRAAAFLDEHAPKTRFFIFGHIHRAGIWNIGPYTIINTGCYGFPIKPRAVILEKGELSVMPVVKTSDGLYSLGNKPLATYTVRAEDAGDQAKKAA